MKKQLLALSSVTAIASALAVIPMTGASATTRVWNCEDGGHTLTKTIHNTIDDTTHTWQSLDYKLTGAGTGGKSNWNATFNDGTGTRNYAADKQDDLDNNVVYTENFTNFTSARSATETWRASAAFDTRATDNHCASSTTW